MEIKLYYFMTASLKETRRRSCTELGRKLQEMEFSNCQEWYCSL